MRLLTLTSTEARRLRFCLAIAALGVLLASAACTLLLDRSTTECQTDSDCLSLGVHPSCQSGACVDTQIPCVVDPPDSATDYLNQCSVGTCLPFDDCAHLGVCDDASGPPNVNPPPADAGPDADAGDAGVPPTLPACATMPAGPGGGPIFVTGSSNFPSPLLANMAPLVLAGTPPLTNGSPSFVFYTTSSCAAADAIFSSDPAANIIHDPPPGSALDAYAQYYWPDGGTTPCSLGPSGAHVDVGESDVYSTTCNPSYGLTAQASDTPGPIQAMAFIVSTLSDQYSISQEAAREVFGTGGDDGGTVPWTYPSRYYVRNGNTGTQQMIGKAIGVDPNEFWGVDQGTAGKLLQSIQNLDSDLTEAEESIGIISNDVYDADRSQVRLLAYQSAGQNCAVLPDSTASSYDKQNVRDGQYPIWGPLHFFTANSDSSSSMAPGEFVAFFGGAQQAPAILDAFIASFVVPDCAMTVIRSGNEELGPLVPYDQFSCECYFLSKAQPPGGSPEPLPAECTPCSSANDCPPSRPACNDGYCEVH